MKFKFALVFAGCLLILTGCGATSSSRGMHHNSMDAVMPGTAAKGGGSYLDEAIPADVLSAHLSIRMVRVSHLDH